MTAEAADELARQTGLGRRVGTLGCDTIAKVLGDLDHPEYGGLPAGAVVIVDEASTVPHRDLHRLGLHARRAGGRSFSWATPTSTVRSDRATSSAGSQRSAPS